MRATRLRFARLRREAARTPKRLIARTFAARQGEFLDLEHREDGKGKAIHRQACDQANRHNEAGVFPNDGSRQQPPAVLISISFDRPFQAHRAGLFRSLVQINCRLASCVHKPCGSSSPFESTTATPCTLSHFRSMSKTVSWAVLDGVESASLPVKGRADNAGSTSYHLPMGKQSKNPHEDQIERDDIIQKSRDDQDQDSRNESDQGR